jgi:hypothetical protein
VHAVARIAYRGLIDNVQASWVKIGVEGVRQLLQAGCNDLGGTLMDENISRAAGAEHGQALTADDFAAIVEPLGAPDSRSSSHDPAVTLFDVDDRQVIPWVRELSTAAWIADQLTHSYVFDLSNDERNALVDALTRVVDEAFPDGAMRVPFETQLWVAQLA